MFERFGRSWRLMKQSYGVLMQDKELLILPVLSGLCILVVLASFLIPLGVFAGDDFDTEGREGFWLVVTFLFYVVTYTIGIFFQAAIVAGATERMTGGDPTVGSALRAAGSRFGAILMWGIVAGTVGMILKAIQERSEWVGRIVAGLLGAAWSLATFFVVPVLVLEKQPVGASFKRSWGLVKERWGEAVIGGGGIGLASMLFVIPLAVIVGFLANAGLVGLAIATGVGGGALLMVFFSALQSVYVAALYRYATTEAAPKGFGIAEIKGAFRHK